VFGTGANVAFRTELLRRIGGFDVALGAGTIAAGGEDLDAFVRIVTTGHSIAYEPAALVWHHHRADLAGLERQMFAYGSGLSAFLVKHLLDPGTRGPLVRRLPIGILRLVRIPAATTAGLTSRHGPSPVRPRTLLTQEFAGMLAGPLLYLRSRRAAREIAAVPLPPASAVADRAA
jgi:cellulose synthase/poly-beta-1,6-N-acetylglucosamine synthase-like glycosyltransferase